MNVLKVPVPFITKSSVREFAESLNIKTSVVVGRLMFEQYIGYGHPLRSEIDKYEFKAEGR